MKTYGRSALSTVIYFLSLGLTLNATLPANATSVVLTNMPAYNMENIGCAPTAAGMILGYWSLRGYTNLFSAQGNSLYLTTTVQEQISSAAHNAKYNPVPDDPNLPTPPDTSIACFMKTSVNLPAGDTYLPDARNGITNYARYKGYVFEVIKPLTEFQTSNLGINWTIFTNEICMKRPLFFHVDYSGTCPSRTGNHFVPVFGYRDDEINGKEYACYDTWSEEEANIRWKKFQIVGTGNLFGINQMIKIIPPVIKIPAIVSISPPVTNIGASAFTLIINGTNFFSTSVVSFNGLTKIPTSVNLTKLTIQITTNDLSTAGVYSISVENPGLCGGISNPQTFTVNNPTPIIVSVAPKNKTINANGFDLIIVGTNFVTTSAAKFNGLTRNTTYLNQTQLKVSVLKSDLLITGVYPITVITPNPGGGISNSQNFTVIKGTLICIF